MNIILRLAWRNLWRRPRRTWLTIGAMVFCNVLLVFMISLQFGMYRLMIENTLKPLTGHVQVQAPGYVDEPRMRLTVPGIRALAGRLREGLGIESVAARARASVLASSETRSYGIALVGVEPRFEPVVSSLPGLVTQGRYLSADDAAEVVVGSVLARNLRVGIGDELTVLGSGRDGSIAASVLDIVGIFASGIAELDRTIAHVPLIHFQDVFAMRGAGHYVVADAESLDAVPAMADRIRGLLPAGENLVVYDWNRLEPGLKQAIQADIGSAVFMYGVLAVLAAFSVMNTQLMSVLERTHEFGIVMSLGLRPGDLVRLVMYETVLLGLLGFVIGSVAGVVATGWFAVHGFTFPGLEEMSVMFNLPARMHPELSAASILSGPAIIFSFTLVAALYPAFRLHWLEPVEAMRAA